MGLSKGFQFSRGHNDPLFKNMKGGTIKVSKDQKKAEKKLESGRKTRNAKKNAKNKAEKGNRGSRGAW